MTKLHLMRVTR